MGRISRVILSLSSIGKFYGEKGIEADSFRKFTKIHIAINSHDAILPVEEACAEFRTYVVDVGSGSQAVSERTRGRIKQRHNNSKVIVDDVASGQFDDVTHFEAQNGVACFQGMLCHNSRTSDGFSQDQLNPAGVLNDAFEAMDIVRAAVHPLKGIVRGAQSTIDQEAKRQSIVRIVCPASACQ